MKKLLFIALLCFNITALCQSKIKNDKTENHINVKGTQTFIIPPNDFEQAINFLGFQDNETGSSIMLLEIPGPYNKITAGFSKDEMKVKGMDLIKKEEFIINGLEAVLINSKQFSPSHGYNFYKYSLILNAASNKTLLINANFPESQKDKLEEKMLQSILSLYIDKGIQVDPFSSLDFQVDISKTSFKLINSISGTLMFEGPNKEFLLIAKSIKPFDLSDKKGAAINALKQQSTVNYKSLRSSKEVSYDDAIGYQIVANVSTKQGGKPMKAFETILFGDNYYYIFLGLLTPNDEKLLKDIEYIISTFKRK
jgi:hypothetical protein